MSGRRSRSTPLDSRWPGGVAADVAGVRGEVVQLVVRPEHDLHLLDGAPVAASTLSTRERTRRPPSWASAQRRSAPSPMSARRCWNDDMVGAQLLEAGHRQPGMAPSRISVVADRSAWAPGRAASFATSSSTTVASAPSSRMISVRPTRVRGAPSDQRSTMGRSTRTPAGTCTTIPAVHAARESSASFSSTGRSGAPSRSLRASPSSVATSSGSVSRRTPSAAAFASIARAARRRRASR